MTCLIFNLVTCSTPVGHNQASSIQYNFMKFLTEIGILQFNKIHVALSNYLDVVSENETFILWWWRGFTGVVMLWSGWLNAFLFLRKLL